MTNDKPVKKHSKLLAGFIGNVVEWYDFALYGYMASFLSKLFFPDKDHLASLLATYGVFAAGFIMRPLGSAVFGWLGDTIGRSRTMLISVMLMALPTVALGLLPTYATAGVWAPVLLIIVRLAQGLSVGGEFSSSVTYLVETADPGERGYAGSWANMGSMAGMLLGSGAAAAITTFMDQQTVADWAWRLPFLFGGILGTIGILLTQHLHKSRHFQKHAETRGETSPLVEAFTDNLRQTLKATLFASAYGVLFYYALVYLPNWASDQAGYGLDFAMQVNAGATALLLVLIPVFGWISDFFMRRTHLIMAAVGLMALVSWPLFLWLHEGNGVTALVCTQVLLALLLAVPLGSAPATFVEMFPARDRLSGYSVSYNIGLGVVGGSTPMIATALIKTTGNDLAPALFLAFMAVIGVVAMALIRDRSREPLQD
jgi:MHS family proline/betaine transporter-like MFS transporter